MIEFTLNGIKRKTTQKRLTHSKIIYWCFGVKHYGPFSITYAYSKKPDAGFIMKHQGIDLENGMFINCQRMNRVKGFKWI